MSAPGYFIATIDIEDAEKFQDYRKLAGATLAKYGGEAIVANGRFEALEGAAPKSVNVILRFPSYEQAKAWYDSEEYAGPLAMRLAASSGDAWLIEGLE